MSRAANLDVNGKHVKRGCTVRFHGGVSVGRVVRTRMGHCCVDWAGGAKGHWVPCEAVRVLPV